MESWGGALFRHDAAGPPPVVVWNAFPAGHDQFKPSQRNVMINFAVAGLEAFLTRLKADGVTIIKREDSDPNGKFAWILDPDGIKIELWQSTKR